MNLNGGTLTARSGGTAENIGAYAIGVNYQDFTAPSPTQYGNFGTAFTISIADGMAATPAGAAEPVPYRQRVQACMNGEVTFAPCRQHQPALYDCDFCGRRVIFGEFLMATTTGYQIQSSEDWETLVLLADECGVPTEGEKFRLTADIEVSSMLGKSDSPFKGAFNGDGYTMTLNLCDASGERYTAPFRYIENATIRNLKTEGSVNGGRHSAGLVGADVFEGCELVYVFGAADSSAQTYCLSHDNCVFVENHNE